jgi:hypothetical protein
MTHARCWWLTPVILATQEAEIRRIVVQSQIGQIPLQDPISKNPPQNRIGGWLKVKALSSSPSTPKKQTKKRHTSICIGVTLLVQLFSFHFTK